MTNDTTNQTRSATAVFYGPNQRNAALEVAKIVGIPRDAVQRLDAKTRERGGRGRRRRGQRRGGPGALAANSVP